MIYFCEYVIHCTKQETGNAIQYALIIIIIIKKDWQCKAGRGRLTPYQSEDPSLTLPTYRGKEDKGKIVEDKKRESNQANKKALGLLLKPASPRPSNTGSTRSFQRDTEMGIKVLQSARFCSGNAHKYTDKNKLRQLYLSLSQFPNIRSQYDY